MRSKSVTTHKGIDVMLDLDPTTIWSAIASNPLAKTAILADRHLGLEEFVDKHSQTLHAHYAQAGDDLDVEDARAAAASLWRYIQYLQRIRSLVAAPDPAPAIPGAATPVPAGRAGYGPKNTPGTGIFSEAALRRREALLNEAQDIAGMGSFVWDLRDDSLELSRPMCKMTGLDAKAFRDTMSETIIQRIHADDRDGFRQQIAAMIEQRRTWPVDFRFVRPDGRLLWLRTGSRFEFDEQGRPIRCLGVNQDITEQKRQEDALRESEARFRLLLEQTPSIAAQGYGPDGTVHYWNQAAETLYGYSAQEAIGRNIVELVIPPEMRGEVEQAIRHMAATGQVVPTGELSLLHKDGRRVPVLSSHAVIQVPGKEVELFCLDMDIADRKQAEEAVRKNQELFSLFMRHSPIYVYPQGCNGHREPRHPSQRQFRGDDRHRGSGDGGEDDGGAVSSRFCREDHRRRLGRRDQGRGPDRG